MKYPNFIISKTISKQAPHPHIKHHITIIEIKTDCNSVNNIQSCASNIQAALTQLLRYYLHMEQLPHAQVPIGGTFPSFLVYGRIYMKLERVFDPLTSSLHFRAQLWQYVFQQAAPGGGTANFMDNMCQLAVLHWNL